MSQPQPRVKPLNISDKLPTAQQTLEALTFLSPELKKTLNAIMIDDGTNISIEQSAFSSPAMNTVMKAKDRFIQKAQDRLTKDSSAASSKRSSNFQLKPEQPKVFELTKEIIKTTSEIKKNPQAARKKKQAEQKSPIMARPRARTQIIETTPFDINRTASPGKLLAEDGDTFSYVQIQNMEDLRHKPGPEPREYQVARQSVKDHRDENKFRAKHGHKYAESKVTNWRGKHAGVVSEITKEGINVVAEDGHSLSMTQQLNPKALTALGAMNSLFGKKTSIKKSEKPTKLNISAADTLTPSWGEEGTTAIGSPILRHGQNQSIISNSFMSTAVKHLGDMRSRSVTSLKRKELASSKKSSPMRIQDGLLKSESIGNLAKSLDLPGCVTKVISAARRKYPKHESKKLMALFNKILAMLDPKFDEEDVYKTIRILKQLCEERSVREDELDEIEYEFGNLKTPPEADKKHFEIYEFVSCVVSHFREKASEHQSEISEEPAGMFSEEQGGMASEGGATAERSVGGYMSDFTPRNEDYDSDPFLAQVAPPSNHIQATLARKYKIPTLVFPKYNTQNLKEAAATEEVKDEGMPIKMLIKSPSAKARIGINPEEASAAIVVNSPSKASSPQKQAKRRELTRAISMVMNENIRSLKKFFTRIDKLTRESVIRSTDPNRTYNTPAKTTSFLKGRHTTGGKKKRRIGSYGQTAFFSPEQTQQHSDLNASAAATIVRQLARLSESKKVKRDPYEGPDALQKNEVYLYPFANADANKKHLVVKVKERNSSPTKRLINLKNAREQTSKHLGRLGSSHKYNVCVMSKDRDEYHQHVGSRFAAVPASQSFMQQQNQAAESGESDLERKDDSVHYEGEEEVPPEPQQQVPAATKLEQPQKELRHESFEGFSAASPIKANPNASGEVFEFTPFSPGMPEGGPYVSFGETEKKSSKKEKKPQSNFKAQTLPRNFKQISIPSAAQQVKNSRKVIGDAKKGKNFLSDAIKRDRDRLERSSRILLKKPSTSALLLNQSAQ